MQQFDIVKAKFNPKVTSNLKNSKRFIGKTGLFEIAWTIEENQMYEGQWAFLPINKRDAKEHRVNPDDCWDFDYIGWVPEEDLEIIDVV